MSRLWIFAIAMHCTCFHILSLMICCSLYSYTLFLGSIPTASIFARACQLLYHLLCPLITAVHTVPFLLWRLSVISTGGGLSHFTAVCLFSLVSFSVLTTCFFWTRVVARHAKRENL